VDLATGVVGFELDETAVEGNVTSNPDAGHLGVTIPAASAIVFGPTRVAGLGGSSPSPPGPSLSTTVGTFSLDVRDPEVLAVDFGGPATAPGRVASAPGSLVGSDGSEPLTTAWAIRRTVNEGGGFCGVAGPSDRSLRQDGRGSAGVFRLGGIVGRVVAASCFGEVG